VIRSIHGCGDERLPALRVALYGRRWWRLCTGARGELATLFDVYVGELIYPHIEEEVRERIVEEMRPGIASMWSDPRERLGL
jgi:hypothetical protein